MLIFKPSLYSLFALACKEAATHREARESCEQRAASHFSRTLERMHSYQRGRVLNAGLRMELLKAIETGRLVGVVMARLVRLLGYFVLKSLPID